MHAAPVGFMFFRLLRGEKDIGMDMSQVHNIAKRLVDAHGLKAEAEAAQKFLEAEKAGDDEKIEIWRRVRSAIREMKTAHES